jgi:plasmid stabilization system protein ParE
LIGYRFHREAQAEFREAARFYESRLPGLGSSFADEVEHAIQLTLAHPDIGTPVGRSLRQVLVKRFPYAVIYRREAGEIFILAIAHQSRRPGYWRQRK